LAVREVYGAYYGEMGGAGAAPEPNAHTIKKKGKVVRLQGQSGSQLGLTTSHPTRTTFRKYLPALLIFVSIVILIVAYTFLTG